MIEGKTPEDEARPHQHETSDVSFRKVLAATGVLLIGIGVAALLIAWLYQYLNQITPGESGLAAPQRGQVRVPPPPRLQPNPPLELKRMVEDENRILSTYEVVDPNTGKVRIPIEKAMQLTMERGLPSRPLPPPAAGQPGATEPGQVEALVPGARPFSWAPLAPLAEPQPGSKEYIERMQQAPPPLSPPAVPLQEAAPGQAGEQTPAGRGQGAAPQGGQAQQGAPGRQRGGQAARRPGGTL